MFVKNFMLAPLALGVLCLPAHAYSRITVQLPERVYVQDRVLEPGEYEIRQFSTMGGPRDVVAIFRDGGLRLETVLLTLPTLKPAGSDATKVVLRRVGNDYYLDRLWIAGQEYGYEFPLPDRVRDRMTELGRTDVAAATPDVEREGQTAEASPPASSSL